MKSESVNVFSPEMQKLFWENLDPNMTNQITDLETKETWTFSFEELPDLFDGIEEITQKAKLTKPSDLDDEQVRMLIKLISSMPYGKSISALSMLDMHSTTESSLGWSAKLFIEATNIYQNKPADELNTDCKVLHDRIKIFSRYKLFGELFRNNKFGV